MAAATKTVTTKAAQTTPAVAASSTGTVATITAIVMNERVWFSTNPLVSIYPWIGQSLNAPGQSLSIVVNPGQTLYSYNTQPAQLSITTL